MPRHAAKFSVESPETNKSLQRILGNSQKDKFIEAARAAGCDQDEAAFKKRLEKIAKPPKQARPK